MPLPKSLDKHRRALIKFWLRFRHVIIGAVAAVVVVGGGIVAWQAWQEGAEESRQSEVESTARWLAEDVKAAANAMVDGVDSALDPAALAELLAGGDGAAIKAREAELAATIPGALGVRLLSTAVREPNYDASPPITYASLEMMRVASENGESPPPEVLLMGEDEQHVAVVTPLKTADDAAVSGHVLVGLDVALVSDAVNNADLRSGYAELVQTGGGRAVVGRKGDIAYRQGVPSASIPIRGTLLRVQYWPEAAGLPAKAGDAGLPILPIGGGILLAALAAGAVFWQRRKKLATSEAESPEKAPAGVADKLPSLRSNPREDLEGLEVEEDVDATAAAMLDGASSGPIVLSDAIFRAYDIRGVVGETLTVDVVRQIGLALGSEAYDRGQQTLCVGCDGRESSPEMVAALVEGLRESGRDVIDVGRVPTPVLYFATYYLETASGVMVTGSHNPPEYNGLKMMLGGDTLFGEDIQALKARIQNGEFTSGSGNLQTMDISADYIRRVSEDVPVALGNAFKVVVDCGNGIAGDFAPKLIRALGHDVVELFCEVDGSFPNHHPDPSQPENLADLIAAVKDNDADLGFAFDGDGDRLGVVDATGHIVWPDAQMMLFARDVLSRNAGAEIVFDVKCSSRLSKVIAKLGGKPVMYKTGHSFIKNKLKETGAPLAGEMSGHIFFKERWYGFDDALYSACRLLEILMGFKQKPSEVFAKLPAGVSTPELNVAMQEGENLQFMESLSDTSGFGDGEVTTIDGVRVDWPDGWGLVRASNTTPSLVLRFEGDDEAALERVKETFRTLLLEKKPDLELPF